jgi:hypothetical protein
MIRASGRRARSRSTIRATSATLPRHTLNRPDAELVLAPNLLE